MLDRSLHALLLAAKPAFTHPTRVGFPDCVLGGRLHYPKLLELVHEAYEALLERHGVSLARVLRERAWGAPLVHTSLELLGDLPSYGMELDVHVVAVHVRQHAISYGYRITDHATGEPRAIATTAHAFVTLPSLEKLAVPSSIQAIAAAIPGKLGPAAPSPERDILVTAPARFKHRFEVAYDDVDAAGFVFFARLCALFHRAYTHLRRERGVEIGEYAGKPTSRIRTTEAWFARPLRAGEVAEVAVVSLASNPGNSTVQVGFRITTPAGEPVAMGTLVHEGAPVFGLDG